MHRGEVVRLGDAVPSDVSEDRSRAGTVRTAVLEVEPFFAEHAAFASFNLAGLAAECGQSDFLLTNLTLPSGLIHSI